MTPSAPAPAWMLPESPSRGEGRHLPPRAWVHSDAPRLSLNGTWAFRLHSSAHPEGRQADGTPIEPSFDTGDGSTGRWETIELPAHWVLTGEGERGLPAYTNIQLPIPMDVPHVPDANPTADHVREIELPGSWPLGEEGGLDVLRLDGVESFASVWVNGTWVGSTQGSRLPTELDVTGLLHAGANQVAIRVSQWSPGTYVEDQDQWWMPGIFRDVTLIHRPAGRIDDVFAVPDFDPETGTGTLEVDVAAPDQAFPVTVTLTGCAAQAVLESPGKVQLVVEKAEPWSAEVPRLYELEVSASGETVTLATGFRRVEVVEGQLRVNGRRLVLAGVNRHEVRADAGRVFDEEWARADLALMKSFNVNAIRTSHYPPHPRLLDLADEIGLWVMDECDLETHSFQDGDWQDNPADDPQWTPVLVDRIRRMVERDKNHPSIIMWSLGNESGTGQGLAAMSKWVHQRDTSRLVHYESDFAAEYTDVSSRMYPSLEEVEAVVAHSADGPEGRSPLSWPGLLVGRLSPERNQAVRRLPYLMCEYLHSMGTGPGGAEGYIEQVQRNPRHAGGFVWEWRDHSLEDPRPSQGRALRYGGDFGEKVHDGDFVVDGMVSARSVASAGTTTWAQSVAPVQAWYVADQPGTVEVHSTFHTRSTQGMSLSIQVSIEDSGQGVTRLEVAAPSLEPGGSARLEVPGLAEAVRTSRSEAHGETVHVLVAVLDPVVPGTQDDAPFQVDPLSGRTLLPRVGRDYNGQRVLSAVEVSLPGQQALSPEAAAPQVSEPSSSGKRTPVVLTGGAVELGPAVLDRYGHLVSLSGTELIGPVPTLWRAPTDNDEGHGAVDYWDTPPTVDNVGSGAGRPGPSSADRWRAARLNLLEERLVSMSVETGSVSTVSRCSAPQMRWSMDVRTSWTAEKGGVRMRSTLYPSGPGLPPVLPRIGLRVGLPPMLDSVTWSGTGPEPGYADMSGALRHGVFHGSVPQLWQQPVRPQEAGTRPGLRSLWLSGPDMRLMVLAPSSPSVAFSLSPWSLENLTEARHTEDLEVDEHLWLHLDAVHHGIGTRSCGPDVRPSFAARPAEVSIEVWLAVETL